MVDHRVDSSFQGQGGPLSAYTDFFTDSFVNNGRSFESISVTLRLAFAASIINTALSVPLAYRMRGAIRAKRTITAVVLVPMTFGSVFVAAAMNEFLGRAGWLNRALLATGLPFSFLVMAGYAVGIDPPWSSPPRCWARGRPHGSGSSSFRCCCRA
jgi:putative spermidine/putrescine transport system permease protein